MGRYHRDAVHVVRRGLREIMEPIVVGASDGRGEIRIEPIDTQHTETARRKEKTATSRPSLSIAMT